MEYNIVDIFLMFFVYAFFGWCLEIAYNGLKEGHYVNRGFLNGPVCPIYGVGATIVVLCLTPLKDRVLVLFIVSILICTFIELVTGYVLEKIYKTRWWDYSGKPLNIGGYICPEFSLYWGAACLLLMYGLHPLLYDATLYKLPIFIKISAISAFGAVFVTDLASTAVVLKKLTNRAERLSDMGRELLDFSEKIGHAIYDSADAVDKKVDQKREEFENSDTAKQLNSRYLELKEKYSSTMDETQRYARVLTVFKHATSEKFGDIFDKLRERRK